MSLHRVDPRFVLPHPVERAVVLGGLADWRLGLASAGVEVSEELRDAGAADVVVTPARLTILARRAGARSIISEGPSERRLTGYDARRILLRPTRERPTLALPLDQPSPVSYALERWSVVDRRWKAVRMRAARALVSHGLFPSWASPVLTVGTRGDALPLLVKAARELGVPGTASWFLTFGQGDSLSRNAFQLFRPEAGRPEWILKFARVAGYSERFDDDERGLGLAVAAGGPVASRVPRLLGRFEVGGVHASVETAAVGRRLRDVLLTPGDQTVKIALIERICGWILELGRVTERPADALAAERHRLRTHVVPAWRALGVDATLVDTLPPVVATVQHNDLGTWNVVADGDAFIVVDWENARDAALPLWDLVYFLGDALVLLEGPVGADQLPGRMVRLFAGEAPTSPLLFSWVRRAAEAARVPGGAVGAIATLCWLNHSLSLDAHNRGLAEWTPADPARLHGLEGMARAWLEHPALGPSWAVWRA